MIVCVRSLLTVCVCAALVSCASSENYAPVTDISAYEAVIQARAARPYVPKVSHTTTENQWSWPAVGSLVASFSNKNKGIDIGGKFGESVSAAASGKVVYAGNGLRGYGNLLIIKHNSQYLSAYAYNRSLVVHEGEWVRRGQKIAEMGRDNTGKAVLHFEIRRQGIPVNPLNLLM